MSQEKLQLPVPKEKSINHRKLQEEARHQPIHHESEKSEMSTTSNQMIASMEIRHENSNPSVVESKTDKVTSLMATPVKSVSMQNNNLFTNHTNEDKNGMILPTVKNINAPPGTLHMTVGCRYSVIITTLISDESPLRNILQEGDFILAVDGKSLYGESLAAFTEFMTSRKNNTRVLSVLSRDDMKSIREKYKNESFDDIVERLVVTKGNNLTNVNEDKEVNTQAIYNNHDDENTLDPLVDKVSFGIPSEIMIDNNNILTSQTIDSVHFVNKVPSQNLSHHSTDLPRGNMVSNTLSAHTDEGDDGYFTNELRDFSNDMKLPSIKFIDSPPGRLGIKCTDKFNVFCIEEVSDDSPLLNIIHEGDFILGIGSVSLFGKSMKEVQPLFNQNKREFSVLSSDDMKIIQERYDGDAFSDTIRCLALLRRNDYKDVDNNREKHLIANHDDRVLSMMHNDKAIKSSVEQRHSLPEIFAMAIAPGASGIICKMMRKFVTVTSVRDGGFSQAGISEGDIIVAMDTYVFFDVKLIEFVKVMNTKKDDEKKIYIVKKKDVGLLLEKDYDLVREELDAFVNAVSGTPVRNLPMATGSKRRLSMNDSSLSAKKSTRSTTTNESNQKDDISSNGGNLKKSKIYKCDLIPTSAFAQTEIDKMPLCFAFYASDIESKREAELMEAKWYKMLT